MKSMIKLTIVASALLFGGTSARAQVEDGDKFETGVHFGAKAGVNYSNVFDERGEKYVASGKVGFVGGGFLTIPLGLYFAVQPEILFSQKGYRSAGSILGFDYELNRTSNFIDIPLYFVWRPVKFLSIMAGPQFS